MVTRNEILKQLDELETAYRYFYNNRELESYYVDIIDDTMVLLDRLAAEKENRKDTGR